MERFQVVARLYHSSGIVVMAHDSGDGETIYHCPFCGSGQVIARSDGTVECEFCHTAFTVQVQPEMSAFPQTINGVPVDVPGMPGEVGEDASGSDPNALIDSQGDGPPSGMPGSDAPGEDGGEEDGGADEESDSPPPFTAGLRTSMGRRLPLEEYINHLAVRFSENPARTASLIKQARNA